MNDIIKYLKWSLDNPSYIALVSLIILFSFISPSFFTVSNGLNILSQVAITALIAFGMTYVIISGEIDLSVGSIVAFAGMIFMDLSTMGVPVVVGFLVVLVIGGFLGAFSGLVTTKLGIPSFIATLAMMSAIRGGGLIYKSGEKIFRNLNPTYFVFGQGKVFGVPVPVIILLGVFLIMVFLFQKTVFGEYTRAVGSNSVGANLAGISVHSVKVKIFIISGALSALAGIITASRLGIGSPTVGVGKELDAIAAVILGGASFTGGVGTVRGALVGALVITILGNGLTLLGVSSYWQRVALGVVLLLALAVNKLSDMIGKS